MKRWTRILLLLAGFIVIAVALTLKVGTPSRRKPLPQPNGYDYFVRAGSLVADVTFEYDALPDDELAAALRRNQDVLKLVREGLECDSAVPVQDSPSWIDQQASVLPSLKRIAWLLDAEALLFSHHGETNGALQSCLDLVRFGRGIEAGGLEIDLGVGSACELIAMWRMTNLLAGLNLAQCREACRVL